MTSTDMPAVSAATRHTLTHLAAMEVVGEDAVPFLQGQLTCNVRELNETTASFAAFCNPKGRVISTMLLIKTSSGFCMILPRGLLEKVLKKLHMYVLRSKVQLNDLSSRWLIEGLICPENAAGLDLPAQALQAMVRGGQTWVKLPSQIPRFIGIMNIDLATDANLSAINPGSIDAWRYLDISAGIPWLDEVQSEQYIPQMLNLDQLGGISFNKGCYTGQEIIARTHYLGAAKRRLFLGECECHPTTDEMTQVNDAFTREKLGDILAIQRFNNRSRLLMVLPTIDAEAKSLILGDSSQTPITLIPFQ